MLQALLLGPTLEPCLSRLRHSLLLIIPAGGGCNGGGGVSDKGMMDKVSFMIVRANQKGLCGTTVNAGMKRRLCIWEGCCAVHKAEDRSAE